MWIRARTTRIKAKLHQALSSFWPCSENLIKNFSTLVFSVQCSVLVFSSLSIRRCIKMHFVGEVSSKAGKQAWAQSEKEMTILLDGDGFLHLSRDVEQVARHCRTGKCNDSTTQMQWLVKCLSWDIWVLVWPALSAPEVLSWRIRCLLHYLLVFFLESFLESQQVFFQCFFPQLEDCFRQLGHESNASPPFQSLLHQSARGLVAPPAMEKSDFNQHTRPTCAYDIYIYTVCR